MWQCGKREVGIEVRRCNEDAHVLLIDDMPGTLRSLVSLMRAQRWRVSVATDGRQGLHRAQALAPDLILLDVGMPHLDGFATCRLLKESPRTRHVPIIFLTFAGADQERLVGLRHGGVDYILKPALPEEVVARVHIHLEYARRTAGGGEADYFREPMPLLSQGQVILRAAIRLISQHLADLPPLAEISRQVGTHDKKLSAIFRQHLGMTVFAWVREERLRVAREWLVGSDMPVHDIAAQAGFQSAANFSTAFRRRVGVTPSEYRKGLRDEDDTRPRPSRREPLCG